MAIFWSITYGLQQDARARNARAIGDSAAELHHRLGKLAGPLQKLGRTMTTAANDYNSVLATLEGRVFPEVRRLESLGQFTRGTELPHIPAIDTYPRPVAVERYPVIDNDRQHGQRPDGPADEDINFTGEDLTVEWVIPDEAAALNQDLGDGCPDGAPTTSRPGPDE
jgi:hypothetical protein